MPGYEPQGGRTRDLGASIALAPRFLGSRLDKWGRAARGKGKSEAPMSLRTLARQWKLGTDCPRFAQPQGSGFRKVSPEKALQQQANPRESGNLPA